MSKWTPGPWEYGEDMRGRKRVFAPDGREIVRALSTHGTRRLSASERDANATLIAAAPALVKALEACLGLLTGNMDGDLPEDGDPVEMARAALSLAKGTQGETK